MFMYIVPNIMEKIMEYYSQLFQPWLAITVVTFHTNLKRALAVLNGGSSSRIHLYAKTVALIELNFLFFQAVIPKYTRLSEGKRKLQESMLKKTTRKWQ